MFCVDSRPIVVKIGGSTLGSHDTAIEDVAALHQAGERVVVVHGGGSAGTEWLKIHGITSEFVDGLRVTGPDAIDVVVAVFAGLLNKQIVTELMALGAKPFGMCGADGSTLRTRQVDTRLGYVGEPIAVNRGAIDTLLNAGYLPVIAPVGYWDEQPSKLMNVNADTVAGEIAAALAASDVVFLTDVAYVRDDAGANIEELDAEKIDALIASGVASGGMIPKLKASAAAAKAGVRCHIVDGREEHALRRVLEGAIMGTKVLL